MSIMSVEHETAILVERFAAAHGIAPEQAASFFVHVGVSTLNGNNRERFDLQSELALFLASMGVSTCHGEQPSDVVRI